MVSRISSVLLAFLLSSLGGVLQGCFSKTESEPESKSRRWLCTTQMEGVCEESIENKCTITTSCYDDEIKCKENCKGTLAISFSAAAGKVLSTQMEAGTPGLRGSSEKDDPEPTEAQEEPESLQISRPYTKTQMLGFSIYTFPESFLFNDGAVHYTGDQNLRKDVDGRIQVMSDAMETAYARADKNSSTLKVFVAPEFFFRGPAGAYDANSIYRCPEDNANCFHPINEIGQQLEKLVQDAKWKDWLFIFGTVVAAEPDPYGPKKGRSLRELEADDMTLFYNFAPVYKGASEKRWLVPKHFVSTIDFLDKSKVNVDNPSANGMETYTKTPEQALEWLKSAGYEVVERDNSTFSVDGLTIGLEVCLDHSKGKLKATTQGKHVDLQIVSSAGMSIQEPSVVAPIVMLQDGGFMSKTQFATRAFAGDAPFTEWTVGKIDNGAIYSTAVGKCISDMKSAAQSPNKIPITIETVQACLSKGSGPQFRELFSLEEMFRARVSPNEDFYDRAMPKIISTPIMEL